MLIKLFALKNLKINNHQYLYKNTRKDAHTEMMKKFKAVKLIESIQTANQEDLY